MVLDLSFFPKRNVGKAVFTYSCLWERFGQAKKRVLQGTLALLS